MTRAPPLHGSASQMPGDRELKASAFVTLSEAVQRIEAQVACSRQPSGLLSAAWNAVPACHSCVPMQNGTVTETAALEEAARLVDARVRPVPLQVSQGRAKSR